MLEPTVRPDPSIGFYRVVGTYNITVNGIEITIPEGFVFDGASIPSAFWISFFTPYHPKVMKAGLVHDYLYYSHITDKDVADKIFLAILTEKGVSIWRRVLMWKAVSWFGGRAWERRSQFGLG